MISRRAALLLLVFSCSNTSAPAQDALTARPSATLPSRAKVEGVADQTALLTLLLHEDGTAELTGVVRKPIPFRGRTLVPFEAARHEPAADPAAPATGPSSLPKVRAPGLAAPPTLDAHAHALSHVLVVRAPALKVPLVVPLELGAPHEGAGDVQDRWADQSLIIRAPSFGDGTRYTLVRAGQAVLAERTESK